ncbi:hypothetical protein AG1IA_09346 [Rhizoctonia solani AG-1 IA]|uniref:Uncharacterized protein n=1 Tax=Thanatephorus cucumeris (strain AG1-IA) TaxID=983506 RepID=L8WJU0_THACA|nr:hypothetical protein AG1IA_09346 [Rhizoctonia solani AG-1 IA]
MPMLWFMSSRNLRRHLAAISLATNSFPAYEPNLTGSSRQSTIYHMPLSVATVN